ncbi:MAG: hypothetical protein K2P58_07205 [Hyphomonadaceae bacterium]|nr:hypothetical protein [Hyphomonadaceae bacterium]
MRRWLVIVGGAVAALVLAAWTFSLLTGVGVLVRFGEYMDYEAYGFEPNPSTTYQPIGVECSYLTHNAVRRVLFVDTSELDVLQRAMDRGEDVDPGLDDAVRIDSWYKASCPLFHQAAG